MTDDDDEDANSNDDMLLILLFHSFAAELHMVHYKASYGTVAEAIKFPDGIAVLGIMLEISKEDNHKLAPIIEKLSEVHEASMCVGVGERDVRGVLCGGDIVCV